MNDKTILVVILALITVSIVIASDQPKEIEMVDCYDENNNKMLYSDGSAMQCEEAKESVMVHLLGISFVFILFSLVIVIFADFE